MVACNNCQQDTPAKNGFVRNQQRYKCHACGDNFVLGGARYQHSTELKKAWGIILSSFGQASWGWLAKRVGVSRTTTSYWIRHAAAMTDEPAIDAAMQALDVDERWHGIQATQDNSGLSTPWIVAQGEPWPGGSVVVMRQRSHGFTTKSTMDRLVYFIQITGTRGLRSYPRSVISLAQHPPLRLTGITRLRDLTLPV